MILKKVTTHGWKKYVRSDSIGFDDVDPIRVTYYLFGIPVFTCRFVRHYEGTTPYDEAVKGWDKRAKERASSQSAKPIKHIDEILKNTGNA
jgi:hypothetical protein